MSTGSVKKKNKRYKAINRTAAQDTKLSLKAKGLMFYFLSKPDEWKGHKYDVINNCKDGDTSVRAALKELKEAGYIKTISVKVDGKFKERYYEIVDEK
jgi:DNA-binding PadR family transcriptional regulator